MNVLWLDRAEADLRAILDYLIERDPGAAVRIHQIIRDRVGPLADYPALGRPGRVADTRDLVIPRTPYLVVYAVDRGLDAVVILRALHSARLWPDQSGTVIAAGRLQVP